MPNHYTNILIAVPSNYFNTLEFVTVHKNSLFQTVFPLPDFRCDTARRLWGTRSEAYDLNVQEVAGDSNPVIISFCTVWNSPNADLQSKLKEYLQKQHGMYDIKWLGVDPYDDKIRSKCY